MWHFGVTCINVLWWIRNWSRILKPFATNCLGLINSQTDPKQWRYIPRKMNIADLLTTCEPSSDNKSAPCFRFWCRIRSFIEETNTFQNKDKTETSDIRKGILNRSINLVVYLIECKSCFRQYVGSSITPFRSRFNDSKSGTKKVSKNVISIKSNLIVTLLLSLIGQKIF